MTDRSKTVVLLIDWDNLQICHSRDAPGTELDLNAVTALAQSYGTLVSARAYAEWNLQSERLSVYKAGIEPVFAPVMRAEGSTREGKSLADTVMVADGVDLLWTVAPDVFVLVTSDKDMIPLARIAKQRGAAVVVLGSDLTAIPLVEMSNVFITYRQLLRELDKSTELDAPTGRAPARDRRVVHESRRPSPEPYGSRVIGGQPPRAAPRAIGAAPSVPPLPPVQAPPPVAVPAASPPPIRTAPPAPLAVPDPTPAPMPAGDGATVDGPLSADGIARRRRRRGGRSRGRGGSTSAASDVLPEELESEETEAQGDEVVAVPADEPRERYAVEGHETIVEPSLPSTPFTGSLDEPRSEPTRLTRPPRTRRERAPINAGPLVFSEFGPSAAPAAPFGPPPDAPSFGTPPSSFDDAAVADDAAAMDDLAGVHDAPAMDDVVAADDAPAMDKVVAVVDDAVVVVDDAVAMADVAAIDDARSVDDVRAVDDAVAVDRPSAVDDAAADEDARAIAQAIAPLAVPDQDDLAPPSPLTVDEPLAAERGSFGNGVENGSARAAEAPMADEGVAEAPAEDAPPKPPARRRRTRAARPIAPAATPSE